MKKVYYALLAIALLASCEKNENLHREDQRKVLFTANPLNGKVAFETIDNSTNVIKDEAFLNTGDPKQGLQGFVEQDKSFFDKKRIKYKVVGVIK